MPIKTSSDTGSSSLITIFLNAVLNERRQILSKLDPNSFWVEVLNILWGFQKEAKPSSPARFPHNAKQILFFH